MKQTVVVLDVETTGLNIERDEIIEFGAWRVEEGKEPESLHFLTKPSRPVAAQVLRLTGIGEEELAEAKPFSAYRPAVRDFIRDAVLVGHNVRFDLGFLAKECPEVTGREKWDTLDLARIFFPALKQYGLGFLADKLKLNCEDLPLHRASSDAYLTWRLLEACWEKGRSFDLSLYDQGEGLLGEWEGKSFFHALKKDIARSFPARAIRTGWTAAEADEGRLFEKKPEKEEFPASERWVEMCFAKGGLLETLLPGYENRPGQTEMACKIAESLAKAQNLVIEAGTGTGKSMAYLVPSLWWARKQDCKVVVATHTIPLQEQLLQKDLPKLQSILPFSFKAALLKGRNNYFCYRRWQAFLNHPDQLGVREKLAFLSVLVWLRETLSGDLQELPQGPDFSKVWVQINAEQELCVPAKCPYAARCFLLRARKKAEDAQLLIVNHSLLFSDIKTDFNILPEYQYLVVDEAHHFYHTALEHLGVSLSRESIQRLLEMIYRPQGLSLYGNTRHRLTALQSAGSAVVWDSFTRELEKLPHLCAALAEQSGELFRFFAEISGDSFSFRLSRNHKKASWWPFLEAQVENMAGRTSELHRCLSALNNLLGQDENDEIGELKLEINGYQLELEQMLDVLKLILDVDNRERVTWLEKSPFLTIKSSPVDVSAILREKVFSRLHASVFTSATLTVSGDFQHFLNDMGLTGRAQTLVVQSPFDYDEQMRFFVVRNLFQNHSEDQMAADLARFVAAAAERMGGRTLVLFTSHRFLQTTYPLLRDYLSAVDLDLLAQGIDGTRKMILEEFQRNPRSVLLGANSFWEGIDIPGAGLSCVIVVKLPFWPPSLPLVEARSELLEAQGKNPFQDLMLPEAIIRFKQGFGRLIRTKEDRGIVILLDERVVEKSYGRLFLASLPVSTHIRGDEAMILKKIERWTLDTSFPK